MSYKEKFINLYKNGQVDETTIIKMAVFKEQLEEMMKTAATPPLDKKQLLTLAAVSALVGMGSGAAEAAVEKFMNYKENKKFQEHTDQVFENIYNQSPLLQRFDKNKARTYYDSILHFSPHIAQEPLAAETYLYNALDWSSRGGDVPLPTPQIRELADVEEKASKTLDRRGKLAPTFNRYVQPIFQAVGQSNSNNLLANMYGHDNYLLEEAKRLEEEKNKKARRNK